MQIPWGLARRWQNGFGVLSSPPASVGEEKRGVGGTNPTLQGFKGKGDTAFATHGDGRPPWDSGTRHVASVGQGRFWDPLTPLARPLPPPVARWYVELTNTCANSFFFLKKILLIFV